MSFHSTPTNQILHINAFQSLPFLSNLHSSPSQLITLISNSIDTALIHTPTQSQLSHHADQHNPQQCIFKACHDNPANQCNPDSSLHEVQCLTVAIGHENPCGLPDNCSVRKINGFVSEITEKKQ